MYANNTCNVMTIVVNCYILNLAKERSPFNGLRVSKYKRIKNDLLLSMK
jgi:hypothetical protein